jgi:hypothetical protein
MGLNYTNKVNMEPSAPVKRFFTSKEKAIEAAGLLYTQLKIKETVFVFCIMYGIFEAKKAEYSLRLYSEGIRTDSQAIIYRYEPVKNS